MVPLAGSGILDPIKYHRLFVIILSYHLISICYRSGGASLVKDPPAIQETGLNSWVGKFFPWRRDRLPTPVFLGFLGGSIGIHLQCGRPGFDPWVVKIPWRRAWQPTPVFLSGGSP